MAEVQRVSPQVSDKENQQDELVPLKKQLSNDTLLNQKSLTDEDLDEQLAPESLLEEERRLRQEREEEEAKLNKAHHEDGAGVAGDCPNSTAAVAAELFTEDEEGVTLMERSKFAKLDALLNKAGMYTKFLYEQFESVEKATDEATDAAAKARAAGGAAAGGGEEEGAGAAGAGKKRKGRGSGGAAASKKAKRTRGQQKKDEGVAGSKEKEEPELSNDLFPEFTGELRDYQLKGVKWLISLYQNGVSGILADEMGLGKTVQTIAFLAHLRSKGVYGPYLVVGPLSTLPNWVNEFKRWAPSVPVCLYHGSKQERAALRQTDLKFTHSRSVDAQFPVVCTSYEIVISDRKFLERFPRFKYIIVDEGHRLKNFECKLIRELKCVPSECRLLLTGTPLQNNLSELWSLLNFVLPDVFDSLSQFEAFFDFAGMVGQEGGDKMLAAMEQRNKVVSKLHGILKPFLLRRVKSDVAKSLPGKMEVILYAGMSAVQQKIQEQLRDKTLKDMGSVIDKAAEGNAVLAPGQLSRLNNLMMQMRKNCNHPDLIMGGEDGSIDYPTPKEMLEQCGKLQMLDRLLTRLKARGHKVLVFSQMTKMLDLMESYLTQQEHKVCRLDGGTSWQERQANIDAFNNDASHWIFLLSTRAGGLGINLVAADTVIIYDSDWNPHQDLQAMDRCHRLGQTRPVLVFRLATAHSVEGRMLRRAADKMALERLVIKKGAFMDVEEDGSAGQDKRGFKAEELVAVLKGDISLDDEAQSGVVDEQMLDRLLDRSHIMRGEDAPYPKKGVGYEVVQQQKGASLLSTVQ